MAEGSVVLLVDDEPRIRSALVRMLRREGYRLHEAASAKDALDVLEKIEVDLVISDHKMPGTTGTALLGEIRQRWPHIQRILLSGWVQDIPRDALRQAAPASVQNKPWDDDELKGAIRSALG